MQTIIPWKVELKIIKRYGVIRFKWCDIEIYMCVVHVLDTPTCPG